MRLASAFGLTSAFLFVLVSACSSSGTDDDGSPPPGSDTDASTSGDGAADDAGPGEGGPGGGGDDVTFFKSGTRLKIESFRVDDNAFFRTFVDTALGQPCTLRTIGDGDSALCVPETTSVAYADADCTTLVARTHGETARYAMPYTETNACGLPKDDVTIYPIEEVIPTATVYLRDGADCLEVLAVEDSIHRLGAPLSGASGGLAKLTARREPASATLERVRWVSNDGAELVASSHYVDVATARACSALEVGPPGTAGGRRCVPAKQAVHMGPGNFGVGGPFTDAACTTPAGRSPSVAACSTPEIVLRHHALTPPVGCTQGYFTLAAVGAPIGGPYTGRPGSCSPFSPPGTSAWAVGTDVPMTNFPALENALVGAGRVRAHVTRSDGVSLARGGAFDTSANAACTPTRIGTEWFCTTTFDPTPWCPSTYADGACTTPIVLRRHCDAVPQAVVLGNDLGGGFCEGPSPIAIRSVERTALGITQYYLKDGDACQGPLAIDGFAYTVGPVVAPSTLFARGTLVTE